MFAVLDTNHFSEMAHHSERGLALERRLTASGVQVFTTIVTPQEAFEGWFTLINRQPAGREQVRAYAQFQHSITLLMKLAILPFDAETAEHFHRLQGERVRIGTMDLKIAAICLAHDATLLTRNLVDFEKVPACASRTGWIDQFIADLKRDGVCALARALAEA